MKIIFFINTLSGGGAERVTTNLANVLAAKKYDVKIITFVEPSEDEYVLDARVEREHLLTGATQGWSFLSVLNKLNRLYKIRRCVKRNKPDILIGMMSHTASQMLLATLGLSGTKLAAERVHPVAHRLPLIWRLMRKYLYWLADGIIVQTDECGDAIRTICGNVKTYTIANPISLPIPSGDGCLPADVIGLEENVLLSVGRLVHQKGFDILIDAFSQVTTAFPKWSLVIIGDGPEKENLHAQIDQKEMSSKIHLIGTTAAMDNWYDRADLFVLSSRYEGFPNVLLEAMAKGRPVVSFDCLSGPRALISTADTGVLVPSEHGADGLSRELKKLMSDENLRKDLGKKATYVREAFSTEKILEDWVHVFKTCEKKHYLRAG